MADQVAQLLDQVQLPVYHAAPKRCSQGPWGLVGGVWLPMAARWWVHSKPLGKARLVARPWRSLLPFCCI